MKFSSVHWWFDTLTIAVTFIPILQCSFDFVKVLSAWDIVTV